MRLTTRFLLVCGFAVVASCLVVGFVLMRATLTDLDQLFRTNAVHRAELIAEAAEENPVRTLRTVVTPGSPVISVTLYDENFRILGTRTQSGYDVTPPSSATIQGITASEKSGVADFELDSELLLSVAKVDVGPVRHIAAVISTESLDQTSAEAARAGFFTTVGLAMLAVLVAVLVMRRATRPVGEITRAAIDLERGEFEPASLAQTARRSDEMGLLARRFSAMAQEVQARERRLAEQVSALQVRFDEAERQRSVARITGTRDFADLQERARQMRERRAAADRNPAREAGDEEER